MTLNRSRLLNLLINTSKKNVTYRKAQQLRKCNKLKMNLPSHHLRLRVFCPRSTSPVSYVSFCSFSPILSTTFNHSRSDMRSWMNNRLLNLTSTNSDENLMLFVAVNYNYLLVLTFIKHTQGMFEVCISGNVDNMFIEQSEWSPRLGHLFSIH